MTLLTTYATPRKPPAATRPSVESALALARWKQSRRRPLMVCDWDRTVMLHYAVEPVALQRQVPFALDTFDGAAYVSLVAFTLRRLRAGFGPRGLRPLMWPGDNVAYLNVRTYVRHGRDTGIYFLAEWLNSWPSVLVGPRVYGVPCRFGRIDSRHDHEHGRWFGRVEPGDEDAALQYHGEEAASADYGPANDGTLDAFLLERYVAFTERRGTQRRFDVWHEPWPQRRAALNIDNDTLVAATGPWFDAAEYRFAHISPGVRNVWMSGPRRLKGAA